MLNYTTAHTDTFPLHPAARLPQLYPYNAITATPAATTKPAKLDATPAAPPV